MKRVVKYILVTLLTFVLLALLVPATLYIPFVQRWAVNTTLSLLNDNAGPLRYHIGRLQLRFPLEIELWDVCLYRPAEQDTLVYVHHLKTALDEIPFREQTNFVVHQLLVEEVRTGIDSTLVAGLDLNGSLDTLRIDEVVLNLDSNRVSVEGILLSAPHFAVHYASTDTTVVEEADTKATEPWNVSLGRLDLCDANIHYDQWNVDSLDIHLSRFEMAGMDIHLDTLTIDLPKSHLGLSTDMDLSYLQDSTLGWVNAHLNLLLSREDLLYVAGEALPNLATYWPDSTDIEARLSAYATPDQLTVPSLFLSVPGWVELTANAQGTDPFDDKKRCAQLKLNVALSHADSLLSALVDAPEKRSYRLPDALSFEVEASQQRNHCDALVSFMQDSIQRLHLTGLLDLLSEEYEIGLNLHQLSLSDYLPELDVRDINLSLQTNGQHFVFDDARTRMNAELLLDTLCYVLADDSTQMEIALHQVGVRGALAEDSLRVHADINVDLSEMGNFDSLKIDFLNAPRRMSLDFNAGDAMVGVEAGCDLNQLVDILDHVLKELDIQTQSKIFDINALQRTIPQLSMQVNMRQDNPIAPFLHQQHIAMDRLSFLLTNTDSLRLEAQIDTLQYEDIEIARIGAHLKPKDGNYDYLADVLYEDSLTGYDFNLGVKARLLSDSILAAGDLWADTMQVLDFDGCLTKRIEADIRLCALPLTVANGFLSDDLRLKGTLNGHARLDCDSIDFNALEAALWFDSASVWYGGCDMTLGLPHDSIVYRQGQLLMDHIRFATMNDQPIMIDGSVDLSKEMSNPAIDLMILSDNALVLKSKKRRNKEQFVVGTLPLSTQIAVAGSANDLKVTGQVSIPAGCDLTYYYEEGEVANNSQLNGLVEFVQFDSLQIADTIPLALKDHPSAAHSNLDVQLKIKIDHSSQICAYLPTGKDDKVEIQGGGDLKMSMDGNGDLQLSGGLEVNGGDINFTLPMLPVTKEFALTKDSWLRWSGIVDQPEMNLMAQEGVKCTINDATSGARVVKFVVSILIKGTLENMDIIFDCTAPDDAAIQSELASLTAEDRSKQALMLLIAQTYTGPSASQSSAGLSSANAAISSLVNKELESLVTNKLKHTEIKMDIDTYDATGSGAQQTDYNLSVSQKFFDDRMRVTVGGKMSTGEEVQEDEGAIINDVSVEWLIKKDASQYARLFRHTNYESVLEGQVVETGVGYVQKRDAFRFKHLFIRSDKKRREAREAMLKKLQKEELEKNRHQ